MPVLLFITHCKHKFLTIHPLVLALTWVREDHGLQFGGSNEKRQDLPENRFIDIHPSFIKIHLFTSVRFLNISSRLGIVTKVAPDLILSRKKFHTVTSFEPLWMDSNLLLITITSAEPTTSLASQISLQMTWKLIKKMGTHYILFIITLQKNSCHPFAN